MKKFTITLALTTILLFGSTSCITIIASPYNNDNSADTAIKASKTYQTRTVAVENFNAITTSSAVDVVYTQAEGEPTVEVYAPDNIIDHITVKVKNETLVIGMEHHTRIKGKCQKIVRISAPAVQHLQSSSASDIILKNGLTTTGKVVMKASSSGDIVLKNGLTTTGNVVIKASSGSDIKGEYIACTDLHIDASSAGDIQLKEITCTQIEAKASSGGDIKLSGRCEKAIYKTSSAGDINAKNMEAIDVDATASSGGDISCHVSGQLTARTSSSGEISYQGNPSAIDYSPKKGLKKID